MKLSRTSDFSLRILMHLAKEGDRSTNRELSQKLNIPAAYLVKLVRELSRRRYLRTLKGKGGGVELAKDPRKISLLEIVELNEGPIILSDCFIDNKYCQLDPACGLKMRMGKIQKEIKKILANTSISEIIK